jgi:hypothetical protein
MPIPPNETMPAGYRAPLGPPTRHRGAQLHPTTRTKIVELELVADWSYGQIHKEYPSITLSTIKENSLYA